ncbi:related to G-protein beta WD-40 repeats containing protein, putative-Talaromyces stipitatus [Serendipita indica DSM 11827]|uniref:Related to G-protein beta WD-40 repeats containing protein, putative-Talaromyces stipitatus n=1 Tax=Serendipita indica (strain DSM 11827) TaxID=1109443 RepID=G4TYQ3_SERID|nr:related to G-protein beta WD-40 repeats containing protein, putative-Talaromyces stipitatus [Serendipita indica DSM 11827]
MSPIPDIGDRLSDPVYICEGHLLDINNRSHEDIARYVRANLDQQLDIKEQERIVQYSDGVFIWAATFCRAFKRSNLAKRLLDDFSHSQVADPLDALYLAVLKQALVDKNTVEDFRKVLQVVISVFQPISINSISTLFPKVDAVNEFVQDLGAVFKDGHPDRPIKVLHPTFREFIASNEDRANGFLVQMEPSHSMLAMACLDVLEKTLKYDILDIRSSFSVLPRSKEVADLETRIARKTSPALRYASSYWIHHVSSSEEAWDCWRRVTNFLRDHHLHWAEFMGWRGTLAHGIRGLSQIGTKIGREALTLSPLRINSDDFFTLRHATHFLLRFQDIIHTSPLHAYTIPSELVPTNSPLVRSNDPKTCSATVKIIGKEHLDWIMDAIPLALPAGIKRALLSPDGARVVMSGLIGYLRLWDANTGELIPTSFSAEEEPYTVVQALEFSPDGRYLAIATDISEVHLLDVLTGDTLWKAKTYLGHLHLRIGAMCFLPNESYLAVVLHYKGFDRMWQSYVIYYHIVSGEQSTKTVGLSRFVDTFKVCPGGTRTVYTARGSRHIDCVILAELVSYEGLESDQDDYDGCVYLLQLTIPLSLNRVIEISIDGTTSAIYDPEGGAALILLDCTTGKHIEMADLDEPYSQCAVFAPQGDLMATASSKGSGILLREKHSGRITKRFGTTHSFSNIWFSSDSQRLASLSNDQRIRIWEVKSGAQVETFFDGYTPGPRVSLSHDWTRLLCIQGQEALVYDLTSKVAGPKSRQSNQNYRTGEYIAENSMLVVRSGAFPATRVLSIWSTASGTLEPIATLGELPNRGVETCITPDLCEILCWSSQGDISLYSLVTYKRLPVSFENVKGTPQSAAAKLCFTSNGRLVALLNTSNNTEAVQVWEYRTGRHIMDTQHRKDTVKSYTLSDTYLAVSTFDQVQVYRVIDGNLVAAERISSTKLMTFSPNSDKLAVFRSKGSSKGPLLQAWAVSHTGMRLMGEAESENEDHTLNDKYNLGFSADGMLIVYGSLVWELGSEGLRRYQSLTLPKSLEDYPHSLLTYANGWIHSAFPPGPIVPIPTHLRLLFTTGAFYDAQMWSASGNTMLVWTRTSEPLIFDFSEFVSH